MSVCRETEYSIYMAPLTSCGGASPPHSFLSIPMRFPLTPLSAALRRDNVAESASGPNFTMTLSTQQKRGDTHTF